MESDNDYYLLLFKKNYLIINLIFAGLILGIFIYSRAFDPVKNDHPVKCIHELLLGTSCPACGLSRGFSAIVRGDINMARKLQPNSIAVFSFFVVQFFMRIIGILLIYKVLNYIKLIITLDIILSITLFIFTFQNIISQSMYMFYRYLFNQ